MAVAMMRGQPPMRVVLDETAFRMLAAGGVVQARATCGITIEIAPPDTKVPPDPPQAREFLPRRRRK